MHSFCNFDDLLFAHAEVLHPVPTVDLNAQPLQDGLGVVVHPIPVHEAESYGFIAEEDVLADTEMWHECKLLVDDGDARGLRILR